MSLSLLSSMGRYNVLNVKPPNQAGSLLLSNGGWLTMNAPSTITGNFTVECWVYIASVNGQFPVDTFAPLYCFGSTQGLTLYIFGTGDTERARKVGVAINANTLFGTTNKVTAGNAILDADTWYHISISRQNATANVYINGVYDHSKTNASGFRLIVNLSGSVRIGTNSNVSVGYNNNLISSVRISTKFIYNTGGNFTVPSFPLQLTQDAALNRDSLASTDVMFLYQCYKDTPFLNLKII